MGKNGMTRMIKLLRKNGEKKRLWAEEKRKYKFIQKPLKRLPHKISLSI